MRKQTEPTIEGLFSDGTPVNVYNEDGRVVLSGFYVHACVSRPCFPEYERPENYMHAVFNSRMTDWYLADTWALTEVTPPHTIEPDERAIALALHDGSVWVKRCECRNVSTNYDRFTCSECGHSWPLRYEFNGDLVEVKHCPSCGARVVGE